VRESVAILIEILAMVAVDALLNGLHIPDLENHAIRPRLLSYLVHHTALHILVCCPFIKRFLLLVCRDHPPLGLLIGMEKLRS
jgi:hypothetical protein